MEVKNPFEDVVINIGKELSDIAFQHPGGLGVVTTYLIGKLSEAI